MRAFLSGLVAAFVLAAVGAIVLESLQSTSDRANTTTGVRLDFAKDGVNRPTTR
jgi:hypothetical protein